MEFFFSLRDDCGDTKSFLFRLAREEYNSQEGKSRGLQYLVQS